MDIEQFTQIASLWISYIGIFVVLFGVAITLWKLLRFVFTGLNDEEAKGLRHSLMVYLSLGLDFIIARDVILTLTLENGDYRTIIQLAGVILIRILLSLFVHLEEGALHLKKKAKK